MSKITKSKKSTRTIAPKIAKRTPEQDRVFIVQELIHEKSVTDDYGDAVAALWEQVEWAKVPADDVAAIVMLLFKGDAESDRARRDAMTAFAESEHKASCACCRTNEVIA